MEIIIMNTSVQNTPESRKILVTEIIGKWGKFSENELAALKSRDDLVSKVQSKYSLDKGQAEKDVDALLKGRPF
jgi:uncharacterized protein YjbJ (UPF0337 family)